MAKKTVEDVNLKGKKAFMRVDFNVPLKNGVIGDANRIEAAIPTIKYVLDNGGRAILASHLGRPGGEVKEELSLAPVAKKLEELLGKEVKFVDATRGKKVEKTVNNLKDGEVALIENTRFEKGEKSKDKKVRDEIAKYWASLADIHINDAFGTAHRAHASNVGVAQFIPSVAGYLMEKEIKFIGGVVEDPKKPLVAILGGAKVSDKIGVIESLIKKADKILVGGGMMFTFLKAQGKNIGNSLVEEDKIDLANSLMEEASKDGVELLLPVDTVVAKEFKNDTDFKTVSVDEIEDGWMGLDIGPKSIKKFGDALDGVKTVVWNGPMGVFEMENFAKGTIGVCETLAKTDAITIIGGGDSAAAAKQLGYADDFTHISTGGGASLAYLEGKVLPGIDAIEDK
ncbi:MAG: phosphoglycerate kinase [Fusobacteriota bacterium]